MVIRGLVCALALTASGFAVQFTHVNGDPAGLRNRLAHIGQTQELRAVCLVGAAAAALILPASTRPRTGDRTAANPEAGATAPASGREGPT